MARIALVRKPSNFYPKCVSTHPQKQDLNLLKAREQHNLYCEALKELGLEVIYVSDVFNFADSCFVEDTVVIHNKYAVICNMGEVTRKGEEESIEEVLKQYLEICKILSPGTLEGGDVIHFKEKMISGISQRTNKEGVRQLESILGIPIFTITDNKIIHLKSYITALSENLIILTENYVNHPVIKDYEKIVVSQNEEYAANTLTINNTVIIPEGFPTLKQKIEKYDFDVVTLQISEFQKCEGALTCLSIIF